MGRRLLFSCFTSSLLVFGAVFWLMPLAGSRPGRRSPFLARPRKGLKRRPPHDFRPCASLRATFVPQRLAGPGETRSLRSLKQRPSLIRQTLRDEGVNRGGETNSRTACKNRAFSIEQRRVGRAKRNPPNTPRIHGGLQPRAEMGFASLYPSYELPLPPPLLPAPASWRLRGGAGTAGCQRFVI